MVLIIFVYCSYFQVQILNNQYQLEQGHRFNTMDNGEDLQLQSPHQSSVLQSRSRNIYSRSNQRKKTGTSPQSLLKVIGMIIAVLIFAGLAFKVYDLQRRLNAIEHRQPVQLKNNGETASIPSKEDFEKRITDLERRVYALSEVTDKLQMKQLNKKEGGPQKPTASEVAGLNSTALVQYMESQFQNHKITINFLHMHSSQTYYYNKVDFLKSVVNTDLLRSYEKAKVSFMQALSNYKLPHSNIHIENERRDWERKEQERISREYDLNLPEIPFCIVVATVNNAKNFRYQYNLQSMVNLDYKNFKIVIVDDASTDNTYELIKQWIEENDITHNIVVLRNEKRMTAVPNIHRAITQHCDPKDIVVLADGDDQLLGKYSLKVFSHLYQKNNVDVVYSNHLQFYTHTRQVYRGWSMNYSDDEKKNNRYRDVPQRIAHLRSFKAKLYLKIKEEDLKDKNGNWYTSTYDEVICLPILEMSCGRIYYVEEFFYLYNFGIGTNDLQVDQKLQKDIADEVKYRRTKYQCLNQ